MPVNVLARETFDLPPGQTFTAPNTSRDLQVVRHRTLDFDVWAVVTSKEQPNTFFSPCSFSRSSTPHVVKGRGKEHENEQKRKDLILGPTRQQTETYFKKRSKTFQALPNRYPYGDGINGKRPFTSIDLSLLEDKINDPRLLGSQARLRDSVTDIATSSIISRRNRIVLADNDGREGDMKFFAELVRPMQYKWKKNNTRVLLPSKHGYHPRSRSPTFKRLVEVTDKLESFVEPEPESEPEPETIVYATEPEHDSRMGSLTGNVAEPENKTVDHFEKLNELRIEALGISPSEPSYSRTSYKAVLSPRSEKKCLNVEINNCTDGQLSTRRKNSLITEEEDLVSTADSNYQPLSMEDYFKVDFSVNKSHAELHLFLPQIDGRFNHSEKRNRNREFNKCVFDTSQAKLPSIDITQNCENFSKGSPNVSSRKSKKDSKKKKKKNSTSRARSPENDKEIKDRLNDIPTLISIENEKSHVHTEICPFNPCAYHSKIQKKHKALT